MEYIKLISESVVYWIISIAFIAIVINNIQLIDNFWLAHVVAYTKNTGRFIAISDVETLYEDGADPVSAASINLTEDKAVIPYNLATENDAGLLQNLTTTEVQVFRGDTDITNSCVITWTSKTDGLEFVEVNGGGGQPVSIYLTKMPLGVPVGQIEVKATYRNALDNTTTSTITKIYKIERSQPGENATFYRLKPATHAINTTYSEATEELTYTIQKIAGNVITTLTSTNSFLQLN